MNAERVLQTFHIYENLQKKFDYKMCQSIWPNNHENAWNLWIKSERNLLLFLSRLEENSRFALIGWFLYQNEL